MEKRGVRISEDQSIRELGNQYIRGHWRQGEERPGDKVTGRPGRKRKF